MTLRAHVCKSSETGQRQGLGLFRLVAVIKLRTALS